MPRFNASQVTAGPTLANHRGVNVMFSNYTLAETASGSVSIAMFALPAGATIIDAWLKSGDHGTGAELLESYVTIGGTSMGQLFGQSVTWNSFLRCSAGAAINTVLGLRLTASANVVLNLTNLVGTGTSSTALRMMISYMRDKRGD